MCSSDLGACLTPSDLEYLAGLCGAHDLWLVVDEVYSELSYDQCHTTALTLADIADRVAVATSLSKSHAMSGWRLGWLAGPASLIEHATNLVIAMNYGTPTFIQRAAMVALEQDESVRLMADCYRRRRDAFCEALAGVPGLRCHRPAGGMFVMVDIRACGISGVRFAGDLLENFGVSTLAGEAFGAQSAGHIRVSLGVEEATLVEAAQRITACFNQL